MDTHAMLDEVIAQELENLKNLPLGSKERAEAISNLNTLYKLKNDESKIMCDLDTNTDKSMNDKEIREKELKVREKQLKHEKIFGWGKIGVEFAGTVMGLMFLRNRWHEGFKFEETGVLTSNTFRDIRNKTGKIKI